MKDISIKLCLISSGDVYLKKRTQGYGTMVLKTAQPKCVSKAKGKYSVLQQIKSNLGFDYLDSIFF